MISGSANFPSAAAIAKYSRLPAVECSLTTAWLTGFPAPSLTVPFHAAPETATAIGTMRKTILSHKIEILFQRKHTVWNYNGHLIENRFPLWEDAEKDSVIVFRITIWRRRRAIESCSSRARLRRTLPVWVLGTPAKRWTAGSSLRGSIPLSSARPSN